MRIVTLDTETTGMKETDQVLELAFVSWQQTGLMRRGEDDRWSSLIRPTCPVSVGARAVHHVTDEELAEKLTFEELMRKRGLPEIGLIRKGSKHDEYSSETVYVAAHNMAFDEKMLRQTAGANDVVLNLPVKRICTWRCGMHLYPDSEDGHSNQVLRYYLDLKVPEVTDLPPHRALPDAVVTAALLQHMLRDHTPDELVALTVAPAVLKTIRFGKHRGTLWQNAPSDYLDWIIRKGQFDDIDVMHTARTVLESRNRPLLRR